MSVSLLAPATLVGTRTAFLPQTESIAIPLAALLLALLVFALFLAGVGASPMGVFHSLYRGGFGSWYSWQNTLVFSSPLMLTALCTALPARVGLVVIGGEGALVIGGLIATVVGLTIATASPLVVIALMCITGLIAGGLWIAAAGALRYYRGVNETISSLLLNYIAIAVLSYLVVGPLRDPESLNHPATHHIGAANMLGNIGDTSIHWGLAFGLTACVLMWLLMRRTAFGFAVDMTGGNRRAAQLAGLSVGRLTLLCSFLGGAAAGLAGVLEVICVQGRANNSLNAGFGYEGILIAFIARQNPLAIIPAAILFGGIRAASGIMQRDHNLPDATSLVMQGIIFLFILASESGYGKWRRPHKGSA